MEKAQNMFVELIQSMLIITIYSSSYTTYYFRYVHVNYSFLPHNNLERKITYTPVLWKN